LQIEFRVFLRDVFGVQDCVSAQDSAFQASLPAPDAAQVRPVAF
jgi:hypothetical protein